MKDFKMAKWIKQSKIARHRKNCKHNPRSKQKSQNQQLVNDLSSADKIMRKVKMLSAWTTLFVAAQLAAWCGTSGSTNNSAVVSQDPASDTTPDAFALVASVNAPISATAEASIVVSWINAPSPISVSWATGQYSINWWAWTSDPGVVNNWDTVNVRHTTASTYATTTNTVLTIWWVSATFTSTTVVSAFSLESSLVVGTVDYISGQYIQNPMSVDLATDLAPELVYINIEVTRQIINESIPEIFGANITLADLMYTGVYGVTAAKNWNIYTITLDPQNMNYNLVTGFWGNDTLTIPNHMIVTFKATWSPDSVVKFSSSFPF